MTNFSPYLASLSSASLGSLIFLTIAVLFPSKIASSEKKLVYFHSKTKSLNEFSIKF